LKRGTPNHPKTRALAAALGLPQYAAVGILEALWHFAAAYARRGDVGRHSDAALAAAIDWREGPGTLVDALVSTGWLDRCRCHRLRIHDWPEHADQTVRRTEEFKQRGSLECYQAVEPLRGAAFAPAGVVEASAALPVEDASRKLAATSMPSGHAFLPLPLPLPTPEPLPPPLPEPSLRRRQPSVHDPPRAPANPLVAGRRVALERECLGLVGRLAELTGEDPLDVIARGSHYPGAVRTGVNPAAMSDDRLANTVRDLRADVAVEEANRKGVPGGP